MHQLKHDIAAELPQLKEEIQTLKADNAQLAKLLASYDLLNPTVTTVETTGGEGFPSRLCRAVGRSPAARTHRI